jgi:hypothetical protein
MTSEITSTVRPSTLRFGGFLAITVGALLISLGSLMNWATVPPFDSQTKGVDVWEGTTTLLIGIVILIAMIAMRVLTSAGTRRAVAIGIIVLGLCASALGASSALRADSRFTSPGLRDRIARDIAARLDLPYERVRARLETIFRQRFHVSLGAGIVLVMIGGLVAALGGGLSVAWANQLPNPLQVERLNDG